jgi:hypothetical protein
MMDEKIPPFFFSETISRIGLWIRYYTSNGQVPSTRGREKASIFPSFFGQRLRLVFERFSFIPRLRHCLSLHCIAKSYGYCSREKALSCVIAGLDWCD